jgi:hypothetical protein
MTSYFCSFKYNMLFSVILESEMLFMFSLVGVQNLLNIIFHR